VRYDDAGPLALILAYTCVLLMCAGTDLLAYRVPNVITYPAILLALLAGILMPGANWLETVTGGLVAGGILLLPALFTGGVGMGMGDVKLATFAGLAVGLPLVPPALLSMAISGGVVAVLLLVSRRRKRGEPIPYAPFISAGTLLTLLWYGSSFASLT
jgi:leader peptidase (prepilin peptidase)/N-methyltransferase